MRSPEKDNKHSNPWRRCEMQQECHHVEASVLRGWLHFLHNQPLHKREGVRDKMPFLFAL